MVDVSASGQELVKSISIENLLSQRDALLERIKDAIGTLREAESIAEVSRISSQASHYGFTFLLQGSDRYRDTQLLDVDGLVQIRRRVDASAWNLLMSESGLRTFMDTKARKEWDESIHACKTPELNRDNIESTFKALRDSRMDMFERGVINCFQSLSWNWKTNNPCRFGKRIIKTIRSYGHFDHGRVDQLEDLERVFCILDKKPEEDHRNGLYYRLAAQSSATRGELDDVYMHFRWFKNGNAHITFKRPDLVDRMNRIITKHFPDALPPPS